MENKTNVDVTATEDSIESPGEKGGQKPSDKKKFVIWRLFSTVFTVLLLVLVVLMAYTAVFNNDGNGAALGPYRVLNVLTDSMRPTIRAGSFVISREASPGELAVGDIITFHPAEGRTMIVMHRIIEVRDDGNEFVTQGDANDAPDRPIKFGSVVGKVVFYIPLLGSLMGTPFGIFFIIAVFLLLVVLEALFKRETEK